MKAEFETIRKRVDLISEEVWIPLENKWMRLGRILPEDVNISHVVNAEVSPFKVRLENMLCETDSKEQAHSQNFILILSEFIPNTCK